MSSQPPTSSTDAAAEANAPNNATTNTPPQSPPASADVQVNVMNAANAPSSPPSAAAIDAPVDVVHAATTNGRIPPMTADFKPLVTDYVERDVVPAPLALVDESQLTVGSDSPRGLDGNVEPGPCTTFTCFPKLPAEVRLRIWKYMLPEPRVVPDQNYANNFPYLELIEWCDYVQHFTKFEYHRIEDGFRCSRLGSNKRSRVPITLHVCAESRHETLKSYTAIGRQYIDFERDTLWVPTTELFPEDPLEFPVEHAIPWVKSLLIGYSNDAGDGSNPFPFDLEYKEIMTKFPNLTELIVRSTRLFGTLPDCIVFTNPNAESRPEEEGSEELALAKLRWGENQKAVPRWTAARLELDDIPPPPAFSIDFESDQYDDEDFLVLAPY